MANRPRPSKAVPPGDGIVKKGGQVVVNPDRPAPSPKAEAPSAPPKK